MYALSWPLRGCLRRRFYSRWVCLPDILRPSCTMGYAAALFIVLCLMHVYEHARIVHTIIICERYEAVQPAEEKKSGERERERDKQSCVCAQLYVHQYPPARALKRRYYSKGLDARESRFYIRLFLWWYSTAPYERGRGCAYTPHSQLKKDIYMYLCMSFFFSLSLSCYTLGSLRGIYKHLADRYPAHSQLTTADSIQHEGFCK